MLSTITNEAATKLKHPKLHKALELFMYITGTKEHFTFSEALEKQIRKMRLHFNDGEDCYTDFSSVHIGLSFPYLTDNLDENFNIVKGIIGHEVGHLRFTSKKTWDMYCNTSRGKYKRLASYAIDVLNIVEDDRIEYWMSKVSKFLEKAFAHLCELEAKNIQSTFDKLEKDAELAPGEKLAIIRNAILYIRSTQSQFLPKIDNEEIMDYLKQIFPYMVFSRTSKSTKSAVKVSHKIMEILSPLLQEFEEKEEEKMDNMFSGGSKGSGNPTENNDLNKLDKGNKQKSNNGKEDDSDSGIPKEVKELRAKITKKVAKELSAEEDEKAEEKGNKNSGSGGNDASTDASNSTSSGNATGTSTSSGQNDNNSSSASSQFSHTGQNEDDNKSLKDYVEDITANLDKNDAQIKKKLEERAVQLEQEARKPVTREILGDFMNSTKKSVKQKMAETLAEKKIAELKPVHVNNNLHANCVAVFREKEHMEPFQDYEYTVYTEEYMNLIKRGANELLRLSEQKKQVMQRMQKTGRLDNRRLIKAAAFNAEDVFYKKKTEKEKLDMDVLIFVDRSGSNASEVKNDKNDTYLPRYEVNRIAAIVQHEMLKRAKINHAVWSFEEHGWNNVFSPMIHFTNCFEKDAGLYLKDIGASGANRDGFSLAYAGDYLLKYGKNQKKLLIVISDGQPNGVDDYYGHLAMNDVKNTVKNLKKKGIKTIGIFTGEEVENQYFSQMYENHMFLNNDNINKLPEELRKKLTQEFKEYLTSF